MRIYWLIALTASLALGVFIFMAESERPFNNEPVNQGETCDLSTPRESLRSFLSSIRSYNRDNYTGLTCLSQIITSPSEGNIASDNSEIIKRSRDIFLILENINYDLDRDIPAETEGDKVDFNLKFEGNLIEFTMEKGPQGWHLSSSMFYDPKLIKLAKDLRFKYTKFTSENMEGDTFVQNLMSPYRTFFTLKSGIEGRYSDNLESSVAALDMSEYTPLERPVYGPIIATMLYRIITECSTIHLEKLSADPATEHAPVFIVVPNLGSITMHIVTLDNGRKAWQFTPHSLKVAWKSYDSFMRTLQQQGVNPFVGAQLPLHMVIDDFFQLNYPQLMARYLNTNIYKWIALLLLFMLTPAALRLVSIAGNRILDFVELRLPEGVLPPNRKKFILPVQIMAVGYSWLATSAILVIYKDMMIFSLYGVQIIGALSMTWIAVMIINLSCDVLTAKGGGGIRGTMMLIVAQIIKVVIMLLCLAQIANIFGLDSTKMFAAMGIGGLALALAGKDTLENIFGTMVIMTTRPFAVGDWINFLGMDGTVEKVGVRSTSLRTFYNSELIIPNAKFITTPVDNMGRREWRRYKTFIGVAYDTPAENINGYVQGLKQLVMNHPNTRKHNFHIVVNDFGPSSIDIMVYIFFKTEDWAKELIVRHEFIVDALRLAEEMKINIAFPTTTIHLRQDTPEIYPDYQSDSQAESKGRQIANMIRPVKS